MFDIDHLDGFDQEDKETMEGVDTMPLHTSIDAGTTATREGMNTTMNSTMKTVEQSDRERYQQAA